MAKSNKKVAHGLMALSSAAVLAVYSAGYAKTQPAAQQIAAQQAHRHAPTPNPDLTPPPAPANVADAASARVSAPAVSTPAINEPRQMASLNPLHSGSPVLDSKPVPAPTANIPAAPQPGTPAPSAASTPVPTLAVAPLVTPAAPASPPPPAAAPKPKIDYYAFAATAYKDQTPADLKWKNGTFYGWGTSPHGDIQAAVVIADGQIDTAFIAQCKTRYSCDVIDKLPNMVSKRQSAKLDSVSGATESADAFMSAVEDALQTAKNPNYQAPSSAK